MKRVRNWHWDWPAALYLAIVAAAAISFAVLFALFLTDRSNIKAEANIRATQIQQQRYSTTYNNCIDVNKRHTAAIRALKKIIDDYVKKHPVAKEQLRQVLHQDEILISALVPFRNCKAVAAKAVHPLPAPNNNGN